MFIAKQFSKYSKLLLVLWTVGIIIGMSIPKQELPEGPVIGFDKIVHISMFLIWTTLLTVSISVRQSRDFAIALLAGLIFAIFSEIYQDIFTNRAADIYDIFADLIGVLLGIVVYKFYLSDKAE